jgi:hypothetical protein
MTWQPSDEYLRPFFREVKYFEDCTEAGKPTYHSNLRLASRLPGFTGLTNSTPVGSWTEQQKIRRWNLLKGRANAALQRAISGPDQTKRVTTKRNRTVTTKKTYERFQPHPKKYSSNAARQKAYRRRLNGSQRSDKHGCQIKILRRQDIAQTVAQNVPTGPDNDSRTRQVHV